MNKNYTILLFILLFFMGQYMFAQTPKLSIKPSIGLQAWATYTNGEEVYNEIENRYETVDNRLNFVMQRCRIGMKGKYGDRWSYNFTIAMDFVGKDVLSGAVAGYNNTSNPWLRVWNMFGQYKASANSEALYFTFGYQSPQLSREHNTNPVIVNGMEKAWSQNYIRRHFTGIGPGRSVGLNMGGLTDTENTQIAVGYDVGIFNPSFNGYYSSNTAGAIYNPLLTYRLALHIGDPETSKYATGRKTNTMGKRKGLTVAFAGSYQGASEIWDSNTAIGFDMLFNWSQFNLMGECYWLGRKKETLESVAQSGYIRASYNITQEKMTIEPVVSYVFFEGEMDAEGQAAAQTLNALYGQDNYIEFGVNIHQNANLKWTLFYTIRDGDAGTTDSWLNTNNYFYQGAVGAIKRGDYLGAGLVFKL